jgi:hypothetical protein
LQRLLAEYALFAVEFCRHLPASNPLRMYIISSVSACEKGSEQAERSMGDPAIAAPSPSRQPTLVVNPQAVDNPVLDFFLNYWRTKRGDAILPLHDDFVPRDIGKHLPWVVVVDALPDYSDFRYRVVGTFVYRYFVLDGTGKTVREAFSGVPKEISDDTIALFRQTCVERTPVRLTAPSSKWDEMYFPDFDVLYLPYSSDGKTADRVVNIFTFNYNEFLRTRSEKSLVR